MRFKILIAWWFVVQITLPFTAPLQTVDLTDLFGQRSQHQAIQLTPESFSVPTPARRPTIATPLKDATLSPVAFVLTLPRELPLDWRGMSAPAFITSPRLQHTVLRI
jgi:hypothetical protein